MKTPRFLEYIESDGRQYIDTSVQLTGRAEIRMNALITQAGSGSAALFGMRKGGGSRFSAVYGPGAAGTLRFEISTSQNFYNGFERWDTGLKKNAALTYCSVRLRGINKYADGTPAEAQLDYVEAGESKGGVRRFQTGSTQNYPITLYLFACHDAEQGAVDFASMKLKACTVYGYARATMEETTFLLEVPVRAFFPALDENGRACLYDAISDSYFYSRTETDFIAGPQISRMLMRVWSYEKKYTPAYFLKSITEIPLPQAEYYAEAPFSHPDDPTGYTYEFVGFDTSQDAFTAVYPTRAYSEHGVALDMSHAGQVIDVYAVWKYLWGWLCKDAEGVFYSFNDDGSRRNLGVQPVTAQVFRDYSFRSYPGTDMLSDLPSPSVLYWTKKTWRDEEYQEHTEAPQAFEATLTGVPPLPQLVTYPTLTLRKALDCVTIPAHEGTLWNVSFDGGESWYKYVNGWVAVTETGDGCHKRRLELRDADDWAAVTTRGTIRFRAWLREDMWVSAIRADYVEGGNT